MMSSRYYTIGTSAFNARYYEPIEELPSIIIGSFKRYKVEGGKPPNNFFQVKATIE